ncbi:hypothetical protein D8674_008908 [Pyrus ussuriensis x Pyrus communis]|uniref:Uncharacterized protein n=1 Tax=Pyrus ussuriensis x Pyrus communis TaxID=2448454 RepID=A0A5N5HUR4_9ROSA|nr:hypothetical protein D8674_008908 [Pyrus ussuriensis x Pyrus communis]
MRDCRKAVHDGEAKIGGEPGQGLSERDKKASSGRHLAFLPSLSSNCFFGEAIRRPKIMCKARIG